MHLPRHMRDIAPIEAPQPMFITVMATFFIAVRIGALTQPTGKGLRTPVMWSLQRVQFTAGEAPILPLQERIIRIWESVAGRFAAITITPFMARIRIDGASAK